MRARWLRIVLAGGVAFVVLGRCYLLCLDTFAPGGAGRSKTDIGTATSLQFRYRFWSGALLLSKVIAVPIHFRGVRTCAMFYAVPIYYHNEHMITTCAHLISITKCMHCNKYEELQ